ncbi:phosphate acetyltransferase [Rhodobacteraceae bacterium NNCM2]|nr:phosphate acetyltransferase [Coraliihabitans acroporae]
MLSTQPVETPAALMSAAGRPETRTLVVGADHPVALESARQAAEAGLIEPVLIGNRAEISRLAEATGWDIGAITLIDATGDAALADAAAIAAADPGLGIVMKGQVHTDALMGAMLRREAGIRIGKRLSHIFHMTLPGEDRPFLISDAALNVAPDFKTMQAITENMVTLAHKVGLAHPRLALLSATEEPLPQMPSSVAAREVADWAAGAGFKASIAGPLAFDNAVSPEAAAIKGLSGHPVAGQADGVIVPTIEVGNALFKMMVFFMGACAAGVVMGGRIPIVITSRADPPAARLASTALATLATG